MQGGQGNAGIQEMSNAEKEGLGEAMGHVSKGMSTEIE